eukprot:2280473-Rhodomonas_salina.1
MLPTYLLYVSSDDITLHFSPPVSPHAIIPCNITLCNTTSRYEYPIASPYYPNECTFRYPILPTWYPTVWPYAVPPWGRFPGCASYARW